MAELFRDNLVPERTLSEIFRAGAVGGMSGATAPKPIVQGGIAYNVDVVGGSIKDSKISNLGVGSEVSIQGWQSTVIFSATDADTVEWASGTVTLLDGMTYSIGANNTGDMSALTYIYLDINTSLTELQKTTTAATAVGAGKILMAVAQNNAGSDATFQAFGGSGGVLIKAANIAANSITVNEIAANTITATEMNVSQLSAIAADMGTITAGTVTGALIRTAASGARIEFNSSSEVISVYGSNNALYLQMRLEGIVRWFDNANSGDDIAEIFGQLGSSNGEIVIRAGMGDGGSAQVYQFTSGAILPGNEQDLGSSSSKFGTLYTTGPLGGIALYGDGSDGNGTISGNTTLTADMFYDDLTISNNAILTADGYVIRVKGTLTIGSGCTIKAGDTPNGNNGDNASGSSAGSGGIAIAGRTTNLIAYSAAAAGGDGSTDGNGDPGDAGGAENVAKGGGAGVAGGIGGDGGGGQTGGVAGAAGAGTVRQASLVPGQLAGMGHNGTTFYLLTGRGDSGGSGGGGAGNVGAAAGGGGAGAGGGGGTLIIFAKTIVNAGNIEANGGNGGNGGNGAHGPGAGDDGAGGGAAGSGGSGGFLMLVYDTLTDTGTIEAVGGSAGTIGTKGNGNDGGLDGVNGGAGNVGGAGVVAQIVNH